MVSVLDNKCPACGAKITFDPKIQKWNCEYCGGKFTLEEVEKSNKTKSDTNINGVDVYRCRNCGAEIIADDTVVATSCVYCGSTAILKDKIDNGVAPSLLIPFKKVREEAVDAFSNVLKGKVLAPKKFRDVKNIEKISGIYIPFWAYDLLAKGGMRFLATDTRMWSDSDYDYTETTSYNVDVSGTLEYEKVLVDASSRFDDDLMDSLEPFNLSELVEYNNAYLSGFLAEKYDISLEEGLVRAENRTMNTCIQELGSKVRHQSRTLTDNNMKIEKVKSGYIMLPVFMININYKDKIYTFAMNGQTGKIVGNIPIGVRETIIWTIMIFVLVFIVSTIVMYFV